MQIEMMHLGSNTYIANCGDGTAVVVDIGSGVDRLCSKLLTMQMKVQAILLTHGHFDHSGGAEALRKQTGAPVYVHELDAPMLTSGKASFADMFGLPYEPVKEYRTFRDGEILTFGDLSLKVLHTPGHTAGSVCFVGEDVLFSGDTLFRGSIGRTDIGGDRMQMRDSLVKIAALPGDLRVLPGHDRESTLDRERQYNPYLAVR